MRDDEVNCSEETLSALLDDELELTERRAIAVHVAGCSDCARTLGHLFAARASVRVPAPEQVALPRGFWHGVRLRLNEVDGLIRATDLVPQRRRPIVSPKLALAGLMAVVLAISAKTCLVRTEEVPDRLTRLHFAASIGPDDPGLTQAVGVRLTDQWQPVSRSIVNINGVWALQTIYMVGGLAVSVFRLPAGTLDTRRLSPVPVGHQMLYVAGLHNSTMVAKPSPYGWDVVVSRSRPEHTMTLCVTCPREELLPSGGERTLTTGY